MLHHVAFVRTDVSEDYIASIIRVAIFLHDMFCFLVTAEVPSSPILVTLTMEEISSSEMSVFTRATKHNSPEDGILHGHYHHHCHDSPL
jgi:hypothetical protein